MVTVTWFHEVSPSMRSPSNTVGKSCWFSVVTGCFKRCVTKDHLILWTLSGTLWWFDYVFYVWSWFSSFLTDWQHKCRRIVVQTNRKSLFCLPPTSSFACLSLSLSAFFILSPSLTLIIFRQIMTQGKPFHMQPLSSRSNPVSHDKFPRLPEWFHAHVVSAMYYCWCQRFMYILVTTLEYKIPLVFISIHLIYLSIWSKTWLVSIDTVRKSPHKIWQINN